jgi:flagellar motility protein MotE (MotC chaperone)
MRRRTAVTLALVLMMAIVGVLVVQSARAWGFTTDRHRLAQEMVARETYFSRQLANQKAVLESQRRIYMERFRRLEAQLQQRDDDVAVLRERLSTMQSLRSEQIEAHVIARRVQSSSPVTGGQQR